MSLFKPTYKDKKTGRKKKVSKWWVEVRDHQAIVRRFAAFTDKRQSEVLATKIKQLIACKQNGESPTAEPGLTDWLNVMDENLRDKLIEIGLLNGVKAAMNKPLAALVVEFEQFLLAKERTPKHIKDTRNTLNRIFKDCNFKFWSDISASRVMAYLKTLRNDGISYTRSNRYLGAAKNFSNWMIAYQGAVESPVRHIKPLNVKLDKRHERRALEVDELRRLLEVTRNGPARYNMTGYERFVIYKFAVETGLRSNEIRTLTVGSFDLDNLKVVVKAAHSKGRREDVLPLRADTVALLKEFFRGKLPGVKAFGGNSDKFTTHTAEMFREDLAETELRDATGKIVEEAIPYIDSAGRYCDFHSLRHTAGTLLAASGCHPKVAQSIMRHTDINLTMSLYTHTLHGQESQAVNALPDLSLPNSEKVKTGTDDLGLGLHAVGGNTQTTMDGNGQSGPNKGRKTPFSKPE